jgi:hypothetical protein
VASGEHGKEVYERAIGNKKEVQLDENGNFDTDDNIVTKYQLCYRRKY